MAMKRKGLLLVPLAPAFPLPFSFARIGIITVELALLQGMELLRTRLYA